MLASRDTHGSYINLSEFATVKIKVNLSEPGFGRKAVSRPFGGNT
jgi:hypothetical protein